jgi:hypothetical protein
VRVLFIAGLGRSGSTLIDRALGSARGCASLGEVVRLWQRGVAENAICGCGMSFRECAFWGPVGEIAFGGWDTLGDRARRLQAAVDRTRYIPLMLTGWGRRYQARRRAYATLLQQLFAAIREVSHADLIVDSSKDLSTTFLLGTVEGIEVKVVHLVRDSRAVAYSWTKLVNKGGSGGEMDRYAPTTVALRYLFSNALLEAARWFGVATLRQRYEDFVTDPAGATAKLLEFGGSPDPATAHIDGRVLHAAAHHSVGGNPMRFSKGPIDIRLDREWQDALPRRDRRIVTAMTSPMLLLYRYPIRRGER